MQTELDRPKLWRWQQGRREEGYRKFTLLFSKLLKMDAYILHFPKDAYASVHTDPAKPGYTHHRINIRSNKSGAFLVWSEGGFVYSNKFIEYFRPDAQAHGLRPAERDVYMLSIGWLRKDRK